MREVIELTADELVARHIEARGGLDRIMAIRTLCQKGIVKMPGADVRISGERKRPNLLRIEFAVGHMSGKEGWDGERAWEFNPWKGMTKAEYVNGNPSIALQRGAEFDGPLVGFREKGHVIEYTGREQLGEREAYRLEVTLQDGNTIHYCLDTESLLTVQTRSVRPVHGGEAAETETIYGDYREVAGVFFPFWSKETARGGEHVEVFQWESIEANVPISDKRFQLPTMSRKWPHLATQEDSTEL